MVQEEYFEDNDPERIINYCEQDVITMAQIILKLRNEELLIEDDIKMVTDNRNIRIIMKDGKIYKNTLKT